ncbi:unnamed protein product, partial [Mesorhabditis spiculigera]
MAKANGTRHRVLADSPVYPLEEKLNAVEAALDIRAAENANEADNERLLLVLNPQLEQVEPAPLDNVSVEQLDAIEKQLESLKCPLAPTEYHHKSRLSSTRSQS